MLVAITREVSASIGRCELTHIARTTIDVGRARAQHAAYVEHLVALGCSVVRLPEAPELPDAVFVEDVAVVLDELAVVTRPGAASRRAEREAVSRALGGYRSLVRLRAPATLDGGDVLRFGRTLCVGRSSRTNAAGIEQLGALVAPHGYAVRAVAVRGCLHLKSAVCAVAADTLLLNPAWVDPADLPRARLVEVDQAEPFAANALAVGDVVLHASIHSVTRRRLEAVGLVVRPVDADELAAAEGGVTCCSLLFEHAA